MQTSVMAAFSCKPQQCHGTRSRCPTAAASRQLRRRPSVSWWSLQRPAPPRHTTLRCCQGHQQDYSPRTRHDPDGGDSRLSHPAVFHPSIWGDFFLGFNPAASSQQQTRMAERADELKGEVAQMILEGCTLHERLRLIDALERMCLDHLFQGEIKDALTQIEAADVSDCDLGTVSLWFYLLRKHRYRVSTDVFLRFKDKDGGFSANNPMDLLSLYDAAHLRTHGEIILDEAILFTKRHLEATLPYIKGSLAREIKSSLEIPLPRRVRIYESKHYISTYEEDATVPKKVVQLAKLNSNIMQLQHQQELKIITRWWKDLQVESRLPFARDRIAECYLWILGVYYEPCYSRGRIILAMMFAIATLFDDIYDSYGTSEECDLFTRCIESWDSEAADLDLPGCMRFALGKIFESYQAIGDMLHEEEKYRMTYLKDLTKELVRCYNTEVKMCEEGHVPKSVEEHLQLSLRSGACHMLSCACFVGVDGAATKEFFDWISSMPIMIQALCIILRLIDDLQTYERERLTPHVASTIDSYMKEHNVSIEVAREKILELSEESWKDFNSEWLNPKNAQPKKLLEMIFNMTRTMEFMYSQDDNFTNCHNLKDTIHSLLVDSFSIPN